MEKSVYMLLVTCLTKLRTSKLVELLQNKGIEQVSPSPTRELGGGGRSPLLNARIDDSQD